MSKLKLTYRQGEKHKLNETAKELNKINLIGNVYIKVFGDVETKMIPLDSLEALNELEEFTFANKLLYKGDKNVNC